MLIARGGGGGGGGGSGFDVAQAGQVIADADVRNFYYSLIGARACARAARLVQHLQTHR